MKMEKGAGSPKSVVEELIGEKQGGMEAEKWMNLVAEKLREKEREMAPENWHKYLEQMSKEMQALVEIENLVGGKEKILEGEEAKKAHETTTEPPQSSSWISYSQQKLNEWRSTAGDIGSGLVAKVGEAFPPGTRSEQLLRWIEIATPAAVATVPVATAALIYFGGGGGGGSGGKREKTAKMMIAPGKNPEKMPRADFEANTKGYFRKERALRKQRARGKP